MRCLSAVAVTTRMTSYNDAEDRYDDLPVFYRGVLLKGARGQQRQ